jgi:putative cardiolipin synthase
MTFFIKRSLYTVIVSLLFILGLHSSFAADVKIINDGREALNIRINLIDNAKSSIEMSYFIFENDRVGQLILARLLEAAECRGVKVKILVDRLFNDIPASFVTFLESHKIEIREFNQSNLKLSRRLHDKMFLVDGSKAILGGRNIENTYYDMSKPGEKKNYDDRDIYVQGTEVVYQFRKYYYELWNAPHIAKASSYSSQLSLMLKADKIQLAQGTLDAINAYHKPSLYPGVKPHELICVDDHYITFAHDKVQLMKDKNNGTASSIYNLIKNAKSHVYIDSPYFILTPKTEALFRDAIKRGVKIRLMTNSLKATDGLFPQAAYIRDKQKILDIGIEVYEYFGNYSFHSKSLVIDNKIAMVGSFNFDYISEQRNTETMVIIEDYQVVQSLLADMNSTICEAYKIGPDGRPEGNSFAGNTFYPGVDKSKVRKMQLIKYILVPIFITYL